MKQNTEQLVTRLLEGDLNALPRVISLVEKGDADVAAIMERVRPNTGQAHRVGITGPPGAGKSTLVEALTAHYRAAGFKVAVVGVDPSSPFSGGAILGDRVRMRDHYLDPGVFIRSMATRGASGGLSAVAPRTMKLLDAAGMDVILLETAGVGQTELDVMNAVDTVVVVVVPESGDAIQTMKAGLLEIADIFVVNKADRTGARRMASDLEMNVHLGTRRGAWWNTPVLMTQAYRSIGIAELAGAVDEHRRISTDTGNLDRLRSEQRRSELMRSVREEIIARVKIASKREGGVATLLRRVESGDLDPDVAANTLFRDEALLSDWLNPPGG
ncbi:MAG: methylmalonyl Co-A mutase-associated GTPase MeaB [Chloroflexi bacterium]|nr:methylmalonyl Co-A mutase-associated GTPase MeaB [Chloroflexota bacterium]